MVVKGYYASICHGLTFLGAFGNMVIGLGLAGVGGYLAFDYIAAPYGLDLPGFIMMGAGVLVCFNGVIGLMGGCKEKIPLIKTNMYLSILQILFVLTCLGFILGGTKKDIQLRLAWSKIPEERRAVIETKLQCCGYDETEEGTPGCKFNKACSEFVPAAYKKRIATGSGAAVAGLFAGALSLFGSFCLQRKMAKTEGRAKKKAFTSLQDEARGINRNTRPKRPPRSERTPKG